MRERWAQTISERAEAHWTEARMAQLSAGKKLALSPREAAPLLRALGILRADGSMPPDRVRKYMQINHMVAVLRPAFAELIEKHPRVDIVDVACGRSYLTLLVAYCFREVYRHPVRVLGIDRNTALIAECRRIAELAEVDVQLEANSLDGAREAIQLAFGGTPHALLALHACDTATDDALAIALDLEVPMIAVAPCCHAELAASAPRDPAHPLAALFATPHLRRESGATITDALRTAILRAAGYDASALEFVPSTHTPKNTLLRAMKRDEPRRADDYLRLRAALGDPSLHLERALSPSLAATLLVQR